MVRAFSCSRIPVCQRSHCTFPTPWLCNLGPRRCTNHQLSEHGILSNGNRQKPSPKSLKQKPPTEGHFSNSFLRFLTKVVALSLMRSNWFYINKFSVYITPMGDPIVRGKPEGNIPFKVFSTFGIYDIYLFFLSALARWTAVPHGDSPQHYCNYCNDIAKNLRNLQLSLIR